RPPPTLVRAPTAFRSPCRATRWPRTAPTGGPTRPPRSPGVWTTSRAATAARAARGRTRSPTAGTRVRSRSAPQAFPFRGPTSRRPLPDAALLRRGALSVDRRSGAHRAQQQPRAAERALETPLQPRDGREVLRGPRVLVRGRAQWRQGRRGRVGQCHHEVLTEVVGRLEPRHPRPAA